MAMFVSSPAHAEPFTWKFSGVADSGSWDANDLTGLAYELRIFSDTSKPDQNGFNDFGQWFNLAAEIEIETLGVRTLGTFTFVEQFTTDTSDRLRVRGPGGGAESLLFIPKGTFGDPDDMAAFGPVLTLGNGSDIDVVDILIPGFEIHQVDNALSRITVAGVVGSPQPVPEPSALLLLAVGAAGPLMVGRRRRDSTRCLRT
jgi:hypothetical protein